MTTSASTLTSPQPTSAPSSESGTTSSGDAERSRRFRGMSYEEGAAALAPVEAVQAKAAHAVQRDAAPVPSDKPKRVALSGLGSIMAPGTATAIVLPGFDPSLPADLLLHLHGWGVHDDNVDQLDQQLMAAGNPQMIGLRPRGSQKSDFSPGQTGGSGSTTKNGKAFDAEAFIAEALGKLASGGAVAGVPTVGNVVMTAHSGGGNALGQMLDAGTAPKNVGEILMFDGINPPAKDELPRIEGWLHGRIVADVTALLALNDEAERSAYLAKSLRFRAYYSKAPVPSLAKTDPPQCYEAVHAKLDAWLATELATEGAALPGDAKQALADNYKVINTGRSQVLHDSLVGQGAIAAELKALVGPKPPPQEVAEPAGDEAEEQKAS